MAQPYKTAQPSKREYPTVRYLTTTKWSTRLPLQWSDERSELAAQCCNSRDAYRYEVDARHVKFRAQSKKGRSGVASQRLGDPDGGRDSQQCLSGRAPRSRPRLHTLSASVQYAAPSQAKYGEKVNNAHLLDQ